MEKGAGSLLVLLGVVSSAFGATPTAISFGADTNYVGPAGTSIGTFFNQTTSNTATGGCRLDSSGYEAEPGNGTSTSLNIPGLFLDTTTAVTACNITGTPRATTHGTQTYGVENVNTVPPGINYVANIQITITPTSLVYPQNPENFTVGLPIAPDVPTVNSTGVTNPITYSVSPPLPAGLALNTNTGTLSGTPTAATAAANYIVTGSTVGADFNTYTTAAILNIAVQPPANYSAYAHSMNIKINTTGFTLTGPVTNYPLLIRLSNAGAPSTDNFDFSQAQASGADIRFTATRNNVLINLPYQIEQWAPGTGKTGSAAIWVALDTMYVNDSTHFITMYWGSAGASPGSSGPAVFSPANGYQAVWHMDGGSTGTTATMGAVEPDVTGNNFHMHAVGNGPLVTQGFIGLASSNFDPTDFLQADGTGAAPAGYGTPVTTVGSVVDFPMLSAYTISAWANVGSSTNGGNQYAILSKGNQDYELQADQGKWESLQYIYLRAATNGAYSEFTNNDAGASVALGWHYIVGEGVNTAKAGGQNIYVDGAAVSHITNSYSGSHMPRVNNLPVTLGNYPATGNGPNGVVNWFNTSSGAMLDEISLSNVTRSADWVTLNFQTQCFGSNYTSLGGAGCTTTAPVAVPLLPPINPSVITYPVGDTAYVGPAGTSIGGYFTQTSSNTTTSGCQLDSTGWENPAAPTVMPHGLNLASAAGPTACNITGIPISTTSGTETYAVENLNSTPPGSNYVTNIQLTITPTSLVYPQNPGVFTQGVPVAVDIPTINSTGVTNAITYSVAPALPAGLSLNATTGVLSGTPTTVTATANYLVTASTLGADAHTYTTTATLSLTVQAQPNYSATYTHSLKIKINTMGFTLAHPVTNYPLIIRLTNTGNPAADNFDFSQAQSSGADIRFTATRSTGTGTVQVNLPYEFEQWQPASGKMGAAAVWVSVDTMYVNDSTHFITLYWGNSNAASVSSGPAVFSPANGYQAVWHMDGGSTGTTEPDVTGNNFHMRALGNPTVAPGFIGSARGGFDASDYLMADGAGPTPIGYGAPANTVGSVVDFPMFSNYTVSAWANVGSSAAAPDQNAILSKGNQDYELQVDNNKWESTQYVYLNGATSGAYSEYTNNVAPATITTGWHYIVGEGVNTAKAGGQNIYVDGAAVSHSGTPFTGAHLPRNNSLPVAVGDYPDAGGCCSATNWYGSSTGALLDEISLSNVTRSSDWVTLNFQTQCFGTTYTSLGGTGCTTVDPVVIPLLTGALATKSLDPFSIGNNSFNLQVAGSLVTMRLPAISGNAQVSIVDLWGRRVWSREVNPGVAELTWDGKSGNGGQAVSSGIYVVRLFSQDTSHKSQLVAESKILFTP